jgi:hypothetical protein
MSMERRWLMENIMEILVLTVVFGVCFAIFYRIIDKHKKR